MTRDPEAPTGELSWDAVSRSTTAVERPYQTILLKQVTPRSS